MLSMKTGRRISFRRQCDWTQKMVEVIDQKIKGWKFLFGDVCKVSLLLSLLTAEELYTQHQKYSKTLRGRSFLSSDTRLECFLRGAKFLAKNLRGAKFSANNLRGLKITRKILRGLKIFPPEENKGCETIRGAKFSSARVVRDRLVLIFYVQNFMREVMTHTFNHFFKIL